MKMISTRTHGMMDYLMGLVLIVSPWLFGFANGMAAQNVPVILGIIMLAMSLFTNYELGAFKVISIKTHLTLDILSGLLLAVSPWLFGFHNYVYAPHLIFGILEVLAAVMTSVVPYTKKSNV